MEFLKSYRKLIVFLVVCLAVMMAAYIQTISVFPGRLILFEGQEYKYNFRNLFPISINADKSGVVKLKSGNEDNLESIFMLSKPISFVTQEKGTVNLSMRIFGIIPVKNMSVHVVPNMKVTACGNTIGVKLRMNGILVIGVSDVVTSEGQRVLPARDGGIKTGDIIVEANGKKLDSIGSLVEVIDNSQGKNINLKYKRADSYGNAIIKPVMSADDKKYHIGLWVRDSTAGIGTLTFYDPDTRYFGALGHGITDIDTGMLMSIGSGEILESNILSVKKGQQGEPGELKGVFLEDENKLGVITMNSENGIYGILNKNAAARISDRTYPVGLRNHVKLGHATILANIEGKNVEEYDIEIQKISRQSTSGSKGMVIKIVDKRLLEKTGGIVQGMSGSPIIQDGHIVGAVTHVLVNDPTRGYGIFIDGMLSNMRDAMQRTMKKAG
jgi:stage IV sporulation protein B